jgi:enamine deaminase RidA (YjgF/YER057c/UK114 family)
MPVRRSTVLIIVLFAFAPLVSAAKKKPEKKEITQVRPLLKDPPQAVVAQADRLAFHVSALSAKGLLSAQLRDALKSLFQQSHGAQIVKIRAFVAGSGDLRRVQELVSETFTDKRLNLPALSVIQVGALPLEGAQVVLESTASEKKIVNAHGLAFISGQRSTLTDPVGPLQTAIHTAGLEGTDVRRVTCFLSNLDKKDFVRGQVSSAFPGAAADYVQIHRASLLEDLAECEAVAALRAAPLKPLRLVSPVEGSYSMAALVHPGRIALTGTQLAFRFEDADVRLAFGRLGKALESVGATFKNVAMTSIYPLTRGSQDRVSRIRFEYYDKAAPPASTMLLFEGLPSMDTAFAIDVVAVLP